MMNSNVQDVKIASSLKKWVNSLGSSLWFQLASQKTIHHVVILYYSSKDEVAQPIEINFSLQLFLFDTLNATRPGKHTNITMERSTMFHGKIHYKW